MVYKEFFAYCDRIVQEWNNNDELSKYIPEPFYGNPESSSIVMININPGGGYEGQTKGNVPPEVTKSFSLFAKDFPYLNPSIKSLNPVKGEPWWEKRTKWLCRIVGYTCTALGKEQKDLFPFGLELYPWPSSGIGLLPKSKRVMYPKLFQVAKQATEQSLVPFAVVIGKTVVNELVKHGYEFVKSWQYHRPEYANRTYQLLVNRKKEHYVLATWARGGNRPPSQSFQQIEEHIIDEILNTINN